MSGLISGAGALLVAVVLAIGCANALYAPTFSAVIPILVPRRDLAGRAGPGGQGRVGRAGDTRVNVIRFRTTRPPDGHGLTSLASLAIRNRMTFAL